MRGIYRKRDGDTTSQNSEPQKSEKGDDDIIVVEYGANAEEEQEWRCRYCNREANSGCIDESLTILHARRYG